MLDYRKFIEFSPKYLYKYASSAGLTLTTFALVIFFVILSRPKSIETLALDCAVPDESTPTLQRETLEKLRGREGESQNTIHQILGQPNCTLPKIAIRDGAIVDRDVYLSLDNARAILAYENGQYLGYGFEQLDRPGSESKSEKDRSSNIREIELRKTWGIQAGTAIAKHPIVSGLGDISLAFNGKALAPVDGWVEGKFVLVSDGNLLQGTPDCVIFSSPQIPAYLSKLCGFKQRNLGLVEQGMPIGQTNGYLHITLFSYRKNEDGKSVWVYVSPSPQLIENLISQR
jgi:hypothetical protein